MRRTAWISLVGLALLSVAPSFLQAQGVGSSGDLGGRVTDVTGAGIPGVIVTLLDLSRGIIRRSDASADGAYRFISVPPTVYDVRAEHTGFESQVKKGVVVSIGQTTIVDFALNVSRRITEVTVTAATPIVETERTQESNLITENYIRQLPIDRRDYLSFTLLAPGVADSKALADNTDFRVAQTPQSGLSFYGSNGRGNNVTVDGLEADDDAGAVRPTVSQEAVQEFQIKRSNYSAEFGGASGGVINIVTKSGTNQFHGSAYAFIRDQHFDARNPFQFTTAPLTPFGFTSRGMLVRPPSNRQQFGTTAGLPVKKDKSFLFIAYEGFRRNESASVPVLTDTSIFAPTPAQGAILAALTAKGGTSVPCLTGQAAIPAALCASILGNALTVTPITSPYLINQFAKNSGIFPFTGRNDQFSVRFDSQFNDSDRLFLRYNFTDGHERNTNLGALVGFSRGNLAQSFDSTLALALYHQFSPHAQNEVRAQWSDDALNVIPNDPLGPGINIAGYGFFGRDIFLPSFTTFRHYDVGDHLSQTRGRHGIKWGGEVMVRGNRSESHTFFPGRFNFGELPGGLISPCLQAPALFCGLSSVAPATISALQAVQLGLPQFYQQGFGDPVVSALLPLVALYWQDSWAARSNLTLNFGVRYDLDQRRSPLNTDKDDIAPRLGVAWDPFKDRKTVVRASAGLFYSPIYFQIDDVVQSLGVVNGFRQIPQVFVPLTGIPGLPALNSATIFKTLLAQGVIGCTHATGDACITPSNLTQFGVNISQTGALPPFSVVFSGAPDFQNPASQQASFGVEHAISPNLSISADYIHAHTVHISRARDKNVRPAPIGQLGIPDFSLCPPAGCFINPLLLQDNLYESTGNAWYDGVILSLNEQLSHHARLIANYTLSKAIDEVTDYNSDFQANDQTNLRAERALSSFDERHKLVFAAVLESPYQGGPGAPLFSRIFSAWTFAPILRANSSRPFNLLTGADTNNDHHPTTDRPPFAGRNTGVGPNFWTTDIRLSRRIGLREKWTLEATAEAFNLFNRVNYASVNNVVGVIAPPFDRTGRSDLTPSQPLGFTSAFDPRRFQFGLRLSF